MTQEGIHASGAHVACQRALDFATKAVGLSDPNPRVGCVVVDSSGRVLGEGNTLEAGGPHAEIVALAEARAAGLDVRGATAYVTLEPCSHHGRTPPCCDALIAAGVAKVVIAIEDSNPLVAGQGIARLRASGVDVEVVGGTWGAASRELNIGFYSRMIRKRPWVRMKAAISLDGRTALPDGRSQWITGAAARADGHAWRKRAGAVLTGIGTVRDDDPRLDVRLVETVLQPLRVIVDSRLDITPAARILQPPGRALIYTTGTDEAKRNTLAGLPGVEVATLPSDAAGKNDLGALLDDLARREINEVHVEAGHKLNGSLLREGLVDELLVYVAPKLLGDGPGIAALPPLQSLAEAPGFEVVDIERVGADLRLRLRPPGRADF